MHNPKGVPIDASTLTREQYDGAACVVCGHVFALGDPFGSMPVGVVDGGQVFACTPCALRIGGGK